MDDIVIKTRSPKTLTEDLTKTFTDLQNFEWKLYHQEVIQLYISHRGNESNPKQIKEITRMEPLQSTKDVQKLTLCMPPSTDL